MQRTLFLVFSIIALTLGQIEVKCSPPTVNVCDVPEGKSCGPSSICAKGLVCLNNVCAPQGEIGQYCSSVLDCYNITFRYDFILGGNVQCVNNSCVEGGYAGLNESCVDSYECASNNCSNGVCGLGFNDACFSDSYCGFGTFCNTSTRTCDPIASSKAPCSTNIINQCGLQACQNGFCSSTFSVADGENCTDNNECMGTCSGCSKLAFNSTMGTCTSSLSKGSLFTNENCTYNENCTSGRCGCDAMTNTTKCLEKPEVITEGECQTQWRDLESCVTTNKCHPIAFGFNIKTLIPIYGFGIRVSNKSCLYKCINQLHCMYKCRVQQIESYIPGYFRTSYCVDPPVFNCTSTIGQCTYGGSSSQGGASSSQGGASSSQDSSSQGGASSSQGGASSSQGGASSSQGGASSSQGGASSSQGGASSSAANSTASVSGSVSRSVSGSVSASSNSSVSASASRSGTTTSTSVTPTTTTTTDSTTSSTTSLVVGIVFIFVTLLF